MIESRFILQLVFLFVSYTTLASITRADDPPSAANPPSAASAVVKLFQSGRVPPERLPTIVEMICSRGNEHDLRIVFDRLVQPEGLSPELRRQTMDWLAEAAATRKVKPTGDLKALEKLLADRDARARLSAFRLASAWKLAAISGQLAAVVSSDASSPELRQAAISGLVAMGDQVSQKVIREFASGGKPMGLRMQAIAGLVTLDLKAAAEQAAAALAVATPQDDFSGMLDSFFNRKDGSQQLAIALKNRPPTLDIAKLALRYMYSVGRSDPELSAFLSETAGVASDPPPPTQEEVAKLVVEVIAKGDPARGEMIFRRNELSCLRCHAISRAGGQVGPDLSAVGVSSPVDYLVNSILNPNLAVKEQFVTKLFVTASGQILTGVVVDRDDNRVLMRDAQGKTVTIPTADIDSEADGKSLMPQGLTKFLTHSEVVDLCRFIAELGKPGPYAISQTASLRLWRVMNSPPAELTQEIPHLEHIRELVLGSPLEAWSSAYANVAGALPLDEIRRDKSRGAVILQGHVQIKEAGKLGFNIASSEQYQVWIDAESYSSKNQFELPLQAGKHAITLRVELSEREQAQIKVDVFKPDGATTQFELVSGA